jgi:hypothetical protein
LIGSLVLPVSFLSASLSLSFGLLFLPLSL